MTILSKTKLYSGETEDFLLGGRVKLRQPIEGYRAAIDPVFLAASIDVKIGDTVFDVGAGHGAASICLAHRRPGCKITGVEIQSNLARLANENVRLNGFHSRVQILAGDLIKPPSDITPSSFDHVMANPPFSHKNSASTKFGKARDLSNFEGEAELSDWIGCMLRMASSKGTITLIHRADRLDEILSLLFGRAGEITIFPLWPKVGSSAKRVIVRARKDIRTPTVVSSGLVLHQDDGTFTPAANKILNGDANVLIMGPVT